MIVYNYHPITKEYLSTADAQMSPEEAGVYLIPKYATSEPVIEEKEGYARCFDESQNTWIYVIDYRNRVLYSKEDGSLVTNIPLGVRPEDIDATELPRPSEFYDFSESEWKENVLRGQEYALSLLKDYRNKKLDSGVKWDDTWWHTNDHAKIQYTAFAAMEDENLEVEWYAIDKKTVMNAEIARAILHSICVSENDIMNNYFIHYEAIKNSESPLTYDFSQGWPESYYQ